MTRRGFTRGSFFALLLATQAWTLAEEVNQPQIDALLDRVEASSCQFLRNGVAYSGKDAAAHLRKKRDIAVKLVGQRTLTPERFIKYVATSSETSGSPYLIECEWGRHALSDWLKDQLKELQGAAPKTL